METTIQLDEQLLAQAKQYAEEVQRPLSQVIADALREKLAASVPSVPKVPRGPNVESLSLHSDIKRITGLVPADIDPEAAYYEHVLTRHQ